LEKNGNDMSRGKNGLPSEGQATASQPLSIGAIIGIVFGIIVVVGGSFTLWCFKDKIRAACGSSSRATIRNVHDKSSNSFFKDEGHYVCTAASNFDRYCSNYALSIKNHGKLCTLKKDDEEFHLELTVIYKNTKTTVYCKSLAKWRDVFNALSPESNQTLYISSPLADSPVVTIQVANSDTFKDFSEYEICHAVAMIDLYVRFKSCTEIVKIYYDHYDEMIEIPTDMCVTRNDQRFANHEEFTNELNVFYFDKLPEIDDVTEYSTTIRCKPGATLSDIFKALHHDKSHECLKGKHMIPNPGEDPGFRNLTYDLWYNEHEIHRFINRLDNKYTLGWKKAQPQLVD
jgi:hypothetical protein